MKPQDQFIIPSISSLPSKLTDVEELFVYKLLSTINLSPPVYFYVNQKRPDCLLIATVDGSSISEENYFTSAYYLSDHLNLFIMKQIVQVRILEIILCLKDLLTNEHNFGWLYPSEKLLIIDFAIDKDQIMKINPTPISRMLTDKVKELSRAHLQQLMSNFILEKEKERKEMTFRAIEFFIGSLVDAIDSTKGSMIDFINNNSYAIHKQL